MSYTTALEDGPSWMNRLPRISSQSRSQARTMSDTDVDELKMPDLPPGTLPPVGYPGQFLRRQKEEDNPSRQGSRASSLVSRRRRKRWDDGIGPGGPITQSAIFPQRRSHSEYTSATLQGESPNVTPPEKQDTGAGAHGAETVAGSPDAGAVDAQQGDGRGPDQAAAPTRARRVEVYDEGDQIVVENEDGEVLAVEPGLEQSGTNLGEKMEELGDKLRSDTRASGWTYESIKRRVENWKREEIQKRKEKQRDSRKHEPARAYQFGNTVSSLAGMQFLPRVLTHGYHPDYRRG